MAVVSDRVRERVMEDFGASSHRALSALEKVTLPASVNPERVHAAVVLVSRRNVTLFDDAIEHANDDWRDLLDRAGLADERWAEAVTDRFGPA